ncbi:hypothetical protein Tco_0158309, partial [Tanacetum coccineum]
LVNISKRREFWSLNEDILKISDSDNQYAVSIKEDTAYPCLHSPNTTKETSLIRRSQRNSIRRIQDIVCEYSGRYQTWSLLQETPIRRIQYLGYAQEPDETLYQAWERFKELLMKCPQHYLTEMQEVILFYNGLDVPTRQILDSRGAIPTKTAVDALKAIQEMVEYS